MTKRKNDFDWAHTVKLTQKRYRRKYHKPIKSSEIKEIWDSWVQNKIIEGVLTGEKIKIDKHSTIEVVGVPVLDDRMFSLMLKGKSMRRDGTMKNATLSGARKDFKYSIVYENGLNKNIRFKADPKFSKQVHNALLNTSTYFRINVNK